MNNSEIVEIDFGEFPDRNVGWIKEKYPKENRNFLSGKPKNFTFSGGGKVDVVEINKKLFDRIFELGQSNILIIGHAVLNRFFSFLLVSSKVRSLEEE